MRYNKFPIYKLVKTLLENRENFNNEMKIDCVCVDNTMAQKAVVLVF